MKFKLSAKKKEIALKLAAYCLFWGVIAVVWHQTIGLPVLGSLDSPPLGASFFPAAVPGASMHAEDREDARSDAGRTGKNESLPFALAELPGVGARMPAVASVFGRSFGVEAFYWGQAAGALGASLEQASGAEYTVRSHEVGATTAWVILPRQLKGCGVSAEVCPSNLGKEEQIEKLFEQAYIVTFLPVEGGPGLGFVMNFADFKDLHQFDSQQEGVIAGLNIELKVDYKLSLPTHQIESIQGIAQGDTQLLANMAAQTMAKLGFSALALPEDSKPGAPAPLRQVWQRGDLETIELSLEETKHPGQAWVRMQKSKIIDRG